MKLDVAAGGLELMSIFSRSAKPTRIDSFMKLISPFGILESARTGLMALPRSPLHAPNEEIEKDAGDLVDASSLPPG
jgi:acetolactate synthase-1/3 small subunit